MKRMTCMIGTVRVPVDNVAGFSFERVVNDGGPTSVGVWNLVSVDWEKKTAFYKRVGARYKITDLAKGQTAWRQMGGYA